MENLINLKFTEKKVDTSMAEEYVKQINESSEWPEHGHYIIESSNNDISKPTMIEGPIFINKPKTETEVTKKLEIGYVLAKKIEESVEMFVQLEYLARGTDPRDVREGHIKLMSQLAMCGSSIQQSDSLYCTLYVESTTPLYSLAYILNLNTSKYRNRMDKYIVVGDKSMRPLCKYFADLCRDVGLHVAIIYINPPDVEQTLWLNLNILTEDANKKGCTGVVTERSDLDSAIDVFIDSSVTAPWRLQQIYVQESIFESFKDALIARAHLTAPSNPIAIGNKTFIIECLKNEGGIPITAYRTTKELLTLINTPYLSVWAAESALSHEIALQCSASTIWINDFASFDGPPRSALSVYDAVRRYVFVPIKLTKTLESWTKLDRKMRIEVITAAMETAPKMYDHLIDLYHDDNIIQATEKTVCFGIQKSGVTTFILKFSDATTHELEHYVLTALKNLVLGNAVVICDSLYKSENAFFDELKKHGAPIEYIEYTSYLPSPQCIKLEVPVFSVGLKVIRTNHGTIFAN